MENKESATDDLACAVCFDGYKNDFGDNTPMVLPCGHTFCYKCVGSVYRNQCPTCREKFDHSKLVKNFAVLALVEKSSEQSKKQKFNLDDIVKNLAEWNNEPRDCHTCDGKTSSFCQECKEYYCNDCWKTSHPENHERKEDSPKCKVHKGLDILLVCRTCGGEFICVNCMAKNHNGHKCDLLSDVVAAAYDELTNKRLPKLQDDFARATSAVKLVADESAAFLTANQQVAKEIESQCQLLKVQLDQDKLRLLSIVNNASFNEIDELDERKNQLQQFISLPVFADYNAGPVEKKPKLGVLVAEAETMAAKLNLNVVPVRKSVHFEKKTCDESPLGSIVVRGTSSEKTAVAAAAVTAATSTTTTTRRGGKVLVTGGGDDYHTTRLTLIWDVSANSCVNGPPMTHARMNHASTTLLDGQVFVCGGKSIRAFSSSRDLLSSCESFNAMTNTFTKLGNMSFVRIGHAAVTLHNGRVFIVGGYCGDYTGIGMDSTETYDVVTGISTINDGKMFVKRKSHTASVLQNGDVLVCGGYLNGQEQLDSTEVYNVGIGLFSRGPKLNIRRDSHAQTTLADGRVLVTGGKGSLCEAQVSSELYDPRTGKFVVGPRLMADRPVSSASLLPDGRVLIIGCTGEHNERTEIYDPRMNTFTAGPKHQGILFNHSSSAF